VVVGGMVGGAFGLFRFFQLVNLYLDVAFESLFIRMGACAGVLLFVGIFCASAFASDSSTRVSVCAPLCLCVSGALFLGRFFAPCGRPRASIVGVGVGPFSRRCLLLIRRARAPKTVPVFFWEHIYISYGLCSLGQLQRGLADGPDESECDDDD
jgi:hypothetical protein